MWDKKAFLVMCNLLMEVRDPTYFELLLDASVIGVILVFLGWRNTNTLIDINRETTLSITKLQYCTWTRSWKFQRHYYQSRWNWKTRISIGILWQWSSNLFIGYLLAIGIKKRRASKTKSLHRTSNDNAFISKECLEENCYKSRKTSSYFR